MTANTTPAGGLRSLTDDALCTLYTTTTDEGIRAAALIEAARRDRAARQHAKDAARWAATYAAWHEMAHAQYLAAEAETNGYLLNRDGVNAGIDPWALWSGSETTVRRYASEELRNFFLGNTRMTVSEYHRQARRERRAAREDAEAQR